MPFTEPANLHTAFAAAMQGHDFDALVSMYEEQAVQLQPDGSTTSGTAAIRAMFEALLKGGIPSGGTQRFALVLGGVSLTSTVYTFPSPEGSTGGSTTMITAEVSRRQSDGSWRVAIDAPSFVTYTSA